MSVDFDYMMEGLVSREMVSEPVQKVITQQHNVEIDNLLDIIKNFSMGDCYCDKAIGNPNMGGEHSSLCREVTKRLEDL